ncbi:TetR/AcrR family transcriptional regulator [Cryptosporangium sp. NPDC048952]|uniref:TetR/AcrR family transcriptional regulator n=1 Tax=Cryptosporangium sp. NPDC048952 TaxID=3363961 RepID=UPI00372191AE
MTPPTPRSSRRTRRPRPPAAASTAPASEIARRRAERREATGRRSDARWSEIRAGAARVFGTLGFAQSTLEDVAAEVGLNRATLYYYVGTKEELLVALLDEPISTLRVALEEVAALPIPAREKLERALGEYARAMATKPELLVFQGENVHQVMSGPEAERIRENADRYGKVLAEVIAEGARSGDFRADIDPAVAVLGILGMFNWMHRWYNPAGPRTLESFGEDFTTMAVSGLTPRP